MRLDVTNNYLAERVVWSHLQVQAVATHSPTTCAIWLRCPANETIESWSSFSIIGAALRMVVERMWGTIRCFKQIDDTIQEVEDTPNLWEETLGARVFLVRGAFLPELLAADAGIHLFYLANRPPIALEVRVVPVPEHCELETIVQQQPGSGDYGQVLRLYCPPHEDRDVGSISDLRTNRGTTFSEYELAASLPGWLLQVQPNEHLPDLGEDA